MTEPEESLVHSLTKEVEAAVLPLIDGKGTVGLVAGSVCGSVGHVYCGGRVEKEGTATPDERTLFEIGSITKVFTTTLLADMHLRGEVDLDDPASKFLPSQLALRSRGGVDVTLRHLATHRSGLPRIPSNMGLKNLFGENPYANYSVEDMYAFLSKRRLVSTPGEFYGYSNLGMGLLGHILALAAEKDFEALVIERICRPLGMEDTAITLSNDLRDRLAPGHARGQQVSNWDIPTLAGCGAFRSTLHDMMIFLKANIRPERTPLRGSIELAQTIQPRERTKRRKIPWRAALPSGFGLFMNVFLAMYGGLMVAQGQTRVPILIAVLMIGTFVATLLLKFLPMAEMGLGWHRAPLGSDKGEGRILWHNGGTGGYRSYLGFAPGHDVGVILLSNSTQSPDAAGQSLLGRLISRK